MLTVEVLAIPDIPEVYDDLGAEITIAGIAIWEGIATIGNWVEIAGEIPADDGINIWLIRPANTIVVAITPVVRFFF